MLLRNLQRRELHRHDPPRRRPRHDGILAEIRHAALPAQKVLVGVDQPVHVGGRRVQHRQDGVGVDGRLAQVPAHVLVGLDGALGGGALDAGGGPDGGDGHVGVALALKVHRQPLGEHAHADLAHGVGGLAAEEARVDGRGDDDDAPGPALAFEDGQGVGDGGVETLRVDLLHQSEALDRRGLHGGPPDRAAVVDEHVQAAEARGDGVEEGGDGGFVAHVAGDGEAGEVQGADLGGHGGDGRGLRVRVWWAGGGRGGGGGLCGYDDYWRECQVFSRLEWEDKVLISRALGEFRATGMVLRLSSKAEVLSGSYGRLTIIPVLRQINRDLSANTPGRANDKTNRPALGL